jgi:hypothetical protein
MFITIIAMDIAQRLPRPQSFVPNVAPRKTNEKM